MKKTNAFIAAALAASMLTACGGTDTAEVTSAESTTAATVSETDTMSAESEETTTVSEVEVTADTEEVDETFIADTESDASAETITFAEPPTPPELAEPHMYSGRRSEFSTDDFMFDFENKLWMQLETVYVSNDECELLFFRNKEDAEIVRIAYVGVEKATGENTTLGMFRYVTDENGEPWWDWDTESYVNYSLAISGDNVLQYFPAGTAVPSTIVLFPECGDFYYYGAATQEEYENNECHWTKGSDLYLTWRVDSDSSITGNFYYYKGSDKKPVFYENGVWRCGSENIWIDPLDYLMG